MKSKNLYIISFGPDVIICMYSPPPARHFLSLILGTSLPPYPGGIICEWPHKYETECYSMNKTVAIWS